MAATAFALFAFVDSAPAKQLVAVFKGKYLVSVQWVIVDGVKRPGGILPSSNATAKLYANGTLDFTIRGFRRDRFRGRLNHRGKIVFPPAPGVKHRGFIRGNKLRDRVSSRTAANGRVRILIAAERVR